MPSTPVDSSDRPPGAVRVRTRRPKFGRYTIHDVASLAGVASVTASRYFNEPGKVSAELRARIEAVIQQTGYMPNQIAKQLASNQGRVVGAVMQNVVSPTFSQMVQGMSDALEERGQQLFLANSRYSQASEEQAIRNFATWHPSALILTRGDHVQTAEQFLRGLRIPVVEAWEVLDDRPFHQVGFRQRDVGQLVTEHLLERGARRIRFALTSAENDTRIGRRIEGYAAMMKAAGLACDIVRTDVADEHDAGIKHIERFAGESAASRPQAILFANDNMAIAALLRAPDLGVEIPRDCAVAGFGDAPISGILRPALTTVRAQPYRIGFEAARLALEFRDRPAAEQGEALRLIVPCELVVRASTGRSW